MQVGLKGCKYLHPQASFGWSVDVYTSEIPVLFQIWAQGTTTSDVHTNEVPVLFQVWAQGTSDHVHTNEVPVLFQVWAPGTSDHVHTNEVPVLFQVWASGTSDNVHTNEVPVLFQVWAQGTSDHVHTNEAPVLFQVWAQGTSDNVHTNEVPVLFQIWAPQGASDNGHTNEVPVLFQVWAPQGTSEECKNVALARSVILSPYVPTLLTILLMQTTGQKLAMLTVMFWRLCIHQRSILNKQDPNGVKIWFCGLTWEKAYERSFGMRVLVTEFDRLGVTLCGWQDIKIQLLTNYCEVMFKKKICFSWSVSWCFFTVVCFWGFCKKILKKYRKAFAFNPEKV